MHYNNIIHVYVYYSHTRILLYYKYTHTYLRPCAYLQPGMLEHDDHNNLIMYNGSPHRPHRPRMRVCLFINLRRKKLRPQKSRINITVVDTIRITNSNMCDP